MMIESGYIIEKGRPFKGKFLEILVDFLGAHDLSYDKNIEFSIAIIRNSKILATASRDRNVIKCVAVRKENQGEGLMAVIFSELYMEFIQKGITQFWCYTKIENYEAFERLGMYSVFSAEHVVLMENKKHGFGEYLQQLKTETEKQKKQRFLSDYNNMSGEKKGVGAIVVNCNPFTKGHRYLIEKAAKQCELVHVFVISAEQSWLTKDERIEMVKLGTQDISNVILHETSGYMISPAVFPTYFLKDNAQIEKVSCALDIGIFGKYIAKALSITKRFVGSEPADVVTSEYNRKLSEKLPEMGIELIEFERFSIKEKYVSASAVRKAIDEHMEDIIFSMLPDSTLDYLKYRGKLHG